MSVIVKGMEMPESCYRCPMANDDFYLCGATEKYLENDSEERRPDWCPLVEIPTPHGRLVDVDDFMRHLISNVADLRTLSTGTVGKALHDTPTIVEAEGSEE